MKLIGYSTGLLLCFLAVGTEGSTTPFVTTNAPPATYAATSILTTTHKPHRTHAPRTHRPHVTTTPHPPRQVQKVITSLKTLQVLNTQCQALNKKEAAALKTESNSWSKVNQQTSIIQSELTKKQDDLYQMILFTNADQDALFTNQKGIITGLVRSVSGLDNSLSTNSAVMKHELELIDGEVSLLEDVQQRLMKNNGENALLIQEKILLHKEPDFMKVDSSKMSLEDRLLHEATLLQSRSTMVHGDKVFLDVNRNMTRCLEEELSTIMGMRADILKNELSLK